MQLSVIAAAAAVGIAATSAHAAQRTFVSVSGNDANTASHCSITAPCRSFGAAITVTDADGEIVVQDSGGYGPVVIAQGVTITAPLGVYAGISVSAAADTGVDINAPGARVTLRGLTINGQGGSTGIYAPDADQVVIDRCTVTNFSALGLRADGTAARLIVTDSVFDATDGVSLRNATVLRVERVTVSRSSSNGVIVAGVGSGLLRDVRVVESNGSGIFITAQGIARSDVVLDRVYVAQSTGNGIGANAFNSGATLAVAIRDSNVSHNSLLSPLLAGIGAAGQVASSFTRVSIDNTVVEGNGDGIAVTQSAGVASVAVGGSTIVDNVGFGLRNYGSGAVLYSRGNNTIRGNNGQETTNQNSGTITPLAGS